MCQSAGSLERCRFFEFCVFEDTDEDAGIAAVLLSGLVDDNDDGAALCRGGSGAPMLFDEVPLLDGVGK